MFSSSKSSPAQLLSAFAVVITTIASVGCSSQSTSKQEAAPGAATVPANGPQRVEGKAPPQSGGFPAIVILDPTSAGEPVGETTPQAAVPYMDQVQQTFIPSLLLVRTGQSVEFRNNDEVLHNVRVREEATRSSAFNVAIPTGEKFTFVFARDGFYDVGCDIHPGMSSQVVSITSPYATTADADGRFVIADVPPGSYRATVYAGAQKIERAITVAGGAPALDLTHP